MIYCLEDMSSEEKMDFIKDFIILADCEMESGYWAKEQGGWDGKEDFLEWIRKSRARQEKVLIICSKVWAIEFGDIYEFKRRGDILFSSDRETLHDGKVLCRVNMFSDIEEYFDDVIRRFIKKITEGVSILEFEKNYVSFLMFCYMKAENEIRGGDVWGVTIR